MVNMRLDAGRGYVLLIIIIIVIINGSPYIGKEMSHREVSRMSCTKAKGEAGIQRLIEPGQMPCFSPLNPLPLLIPSFFPGWNLAS